MKWRKYFILPSLFFVFMFLGVFTVSAETISFATPPANDVDGYGQYPAGQQIAQQFIISNSASTAVFHVQLASSNSPTNHSVFSIESDSSGVPSGTVLAS